MFSPQIKALDFWSRIAIEILPNVLLTSQAPLFLLQNLLHDFPCMRGLAKDARSNGDADVLPDISLPSKCKMGSNASEKHNHFSILASGWGKALIPRLFEVSRPMAGPDIQSSGIPASSCFYHRKASVHTGDPQSSSKEF